jgi:PilZ domain-containing protein
MLNVGRRESRSQVRLKVEVCGRDSQGNPFVQSAYARDTSYYGARLDGIECLKGPGDIVQIKYKRVCSKFRVVWVGLPGTKEHGHIGVRSLEPRKNIWNLKQVPGPRSSEAAPGASSSPVVLAADPQKPTPKNSPPEPQKSADKESLPEAEKPGATKSISSQSNRRRFTRHRCLGTVEFRIAGNCTVMSGKLTDVSLGGCYVQAPVACLPGTLLELALDACKLRVHLDGRVAVAESSKGFGIEFVSGCAGLKQLPRLIEAVRRHTASVPARSTGAATRLQRTKPLS